MRGNPDNLHQAAARKSAAAQARAEQGLREIIRRNEPITFCGLAQTAGVCLDFLYRCSPIRERVQQLRPNSRTHPHRRQRPRPETKRRAASSAPSPPAHQTQTASPRRDQHSQTSARGRTRPES